MSTTIFKICLILSFVFSAHTLMAEETIAITGTVNEYFQIITDDGEIYNIGENERSSELDALIGSRVEATGMLDVSSGENVILVSDYIVIEPAS